MVLNYNENFTWKTYMKNKETGMSREYYENFEKIRAHECEVATRTVLEDLEGLVRDLPLYIPKIRERAVHVVGHSYGGYLANLLATGPVTNHVASFVSYAGAWDIKKDIMTYKMTNITYSEKVNPVERDPKKLGKILVLHSKDDLVVPASEVNNFRSWVSGAPDNKAEIKVLPAGGHYFDCVHNPPLFQEMMESVSSFLQKNSSPLSSPQFKAGKSPLPAYQSPADELDDESETATSAR